MTNATTNLPSEQERQETIQKANDIIAEMQINALRRFPIEMRLNYLINMIAKGMDEAGEKDIEKFNEKVNWKRINEIINLETGPYSFNIIKEVNTIRELQELREVVIYASCGLGHWQKRVCKDCGEVFYMEKGEVDFFQNKELSLPVRCKSCRDKRKANKK